MLERFYVQIPVDTEGWTQEEKDFFQKELTFETEMTARAVYGQVMARRAEEMRGA